MKCLVKPSEFQIQPVFSLIKTVLFLAASVMLHTNTILNLKPQFPCHTDYVTVSTAFFTNDEYTRWPTRHVDQSISDGGTRSVCPSRTRALSQTRRKTTAQSICQIQHVAARPCFGHLRTNLDSSPPPENANNNR